MPKKRCPRRLINHYAQARLYDVSTARYVTIAQLKEWRSEGFDVVVREVETGRFVTEAVLPPGFDA
jgi:polyhydroxyalkanoate synthesis regulator protein